MGAVKKLFFNNYFCLHAQRNISILPTHAWEKSQQHCDTDMSFSSDNIQLNKYDIFFVVNFIR